MRTGVRAAAFAFITAAAMAPGTPAGIGTGSGHADAPDRQRADAPAGPLLDRLQEFLDWAHPASGDCAYPSDATVLERWPGGLRIAYAIHCGGEKRSMAAILETREEAGLWQVIQGFETDPGRVERAIRTGLLKVPPAAPAAAPSPALPAIRGLAPPPDNEGEPKGHSPMGAVVPPEILEEARPDFPEEAGRARLIGQAHVSLLVEISPEGRPEQARPLLGPEPDLGMHRAATEAVLRWRFKPAMLSGGPVSYFGPVEITFEGLPEESRSWAHRALFHVEAIVSADPAPVEEARKRLLAGEAFEQIAAALASEKVQGGDWGFVSAAALPAAVRKALHEMQMGSYAGPIEAEGLHYLMQKKGEIYYAIRSVAGEDVSYQILHERNAPEGDALRRALQGDIAAYLADSRRDDYMNQAAALMGIEQRQTEIGQLLIHTDILDDGEIQLIGRVVQAAIEAHRRFWEPIVSLRPFSEQVLVYAFARKSDNDRLHALWQAGRRSGSASPVGEYVPASRILAISCEEMEGHLPVPILIHEAIHMLDYERVYAPGVAPSEWFEEGLATYFGFSQIGGQLRIEPGEIRRSGTIVSGSVRMQFDPRAPLREYLRKVREGQPVKLRALLRAGHSDPLWSGHQSSRGYGAAWTLLHFLKDGNKGRKRPALLEYARLEARGEGGPEAFARLLGPDLDAVESAWHEYEAGL